MLFSQLAKGRLCAEFRLLYPVVTVVVVSEETGDISIAERGQLIRKLSPDTLRGLLTELLGRVETRPFRKVAA